MTIAKLFARIGLDADTKKAEGFQKQLKFIQVGLAAATTLAIGFSIGIKKITDESFNAALALKQFEAETGASAQELQKWQAIADQTNNSAKAVSSSIKAIALNQQKIKLGQGGNISGYQLLGIDPTQDPFEILEELRTETSGLDQAMKKNVLGMMGISSELIQVLELTNEEFERMGAQAFIIPKSAIDTMDKARSSMAEVGQGVKWLKAMIATELAPSIQKLNKEIVKWIKNNKEGVVKTVKQVFLWITKFVGAIVNSSRMINTLITSTIGWGNAMKGVLILLALMNAQFLMSPIGLFIAGIVLLVAVLDDLYIYSTGKGQSLFGNLMKAFPNIEKLIFGILDGIREFAALAGLFDVSDLELGNILEEWGMLGVFIRDTANGVKVLQALFSGQGIELRKDIKEGAGFKEFFEGVDVVKSLFSGKGIEFNPIWKRNKAAEGITPTNTGSTNKTESIIINNNIETNLEVDEDLLEEIGAVTQRSVIAASSQRSRDE